MAQLLFQDQQIAPETVGSRVHIRVLYRLREKGKDVTVIGGKSIRIMDKIHQLRQQIEKAQRKFGYPGYRTAELTKADPG